MDGIGLSDFIRTNLVLCKNVNLFVNFKCIELRNIFFECKFCNDRMQINIRNEY